LRQGDQRFIEAAGHSNTGSRRGLLYHSKAVRFQGILPTLRHVFKGGTPQGLSLETRRTAGLS